MSEKIEWSEATISNNFMFRLVMEHKEICKELLQRVLEIKISRLVYIEGEKSWETGVDNKGIRLDIYVEDANGVAYDIEMQTGDEGITELAKRTRYYQAVMDADALDKGTHYKKLRRSIIIFICTFDPFRAKLGRYTFSAMCEEDTRIVLNDGCTRIFINTKGSRENLSKELADVMNYIAGGTVSDKFTKMIDERVNYLRNSDGARRRYSVWCSMAEQDKIEAREEGLAEGRAEGIKIGEARGKIEGKIETYCDFIKAGVCTLAQAAANLNMSVSEFTQKAQALAML